MPRELKPETLRKKLLDTESLTDFLARMALVWQARQARIAAKAERALAAQNRYVRTRKAADPDGFAIERRSAVKRYAQRHAERIRAYQRRKSLQRAIARAEARRQAAACSGVSPRAGQSSELALLAGQCHPAGTSSCGPEWPLRASALPGPLPTCASVAPSVGQAACSE